MIVFQFHHDEKEEFIDDYISNLLENIEKSVLEDGVLQFDFMRDLEDSSHFILFEVYRDQTAREFHLQTDHFLKFKEFASGKDLFTRQGIGYELDPLFLTIANRE